MNRSLTRRDFLRLMGASGFTALTAGSLGSAVLGMPLRKGQVDTNRYGIMILVDGLRSDLFFQMLEVGELPHIKEHIVDRGIVAECVGSLPSTTGPAHLPFLTGTLPGTNNITGIRWMDRESKINRDYCAGFEGVMINRDYGLRVPTLYEVLHPEETAAIYEIVNKGATYVDRPLMKEAWWASREEWKPFDDMAADLVEQRYDKHLPRFVFAWMPGVDHLSHFEGPRSEEVRSAVMAVDKHVGRIANVLKRHGIYDKALFGLAADHGLRDNQKHCELAELLGSFGLTVKGKLGTEGEWVSIHRYNAVVAVSGNAFAHVYLCDDEGNLGSSISVHDWSWEPEEEIGSRLFHGWKWEREASYEAIRNFPLRGGKRIDLIEALLAHGGIGILLTAEKWNRFLIFSPSGQSLIEMDVAGYEYPGVRYRYSVVEGDDPLRYTGTPGTATLMADGEFHSGDDWLRASWDSDYPDAIVQISQIFESHRCGDIVALAKPGWDLMDEAHIGSHGGMEREEMMVPVALAGPGIVNKRLKYARTVDIFPTYLKFYGLNPAYLPIDGRVLDIFA